MFKQYLTEKMTKFLKELPSDILAAFCFILIMSVVVGIPIVIIYLLCKFVSVFFIMIVPIALLVMMIYGIRENYLWWLKGKEWENKLK